VISQDCASFKEHGAREVISKLFAFVLVFFLVGMV